MESSQGIGEECDVPEMQQQLLPLDKNYQISENTLPADPLENTIDTANIADQNSNSGNLISVKTTDVVSQDVVVETETSSATSADNSMPPLPPPSKDDKGQQPPGQYSADYNMQNYANYNYMYNYNNYYGYPYPQYQWDYNSQQYYQPYQNYYNYNYNANQSQTASSKPPPPPPDAVQLPVEEKPTNKTNVSTVDDSNRYSPTAETDDDDTMKAWPENNKSDSLIEQTTPTTSLANFVPSQTVLSERIEIQQKLPENIENITLQSTIPTITQIQPQLGVPVVAQIKPYTIPVQQPNYLINPQLIQQMQPMESTANELINQQQNSLVQNGKEDSTDKLSKVSSLLGKNQAKKRLMAFSMMKQKLQEQNNPTNDYQNSDVGEGNDIEFVPELNVFQTVTKKKVVTNKKVAKVIKAQQTIEQIEEMKKDELLQGNNAALYQHLLRNGGNEAPILQKLGIESLAEKYSAKIREQDKRLKRHHHRRRDDDRRGHKYRRHSHSKSRSRSRSAEKPKMRALEVKTWKDFINGGFQFDKFRRFKFDEAEEIKGKERKSRMKKRHSVSRLDGKNQNTESTISTETEKEKSDKKFCFNILERKKEILKSFEVISLDGECTKDFPSSIIRYTKTKPVLKFSENPSKAISHLQNRQQMLATLLPEIETIVFKFLSSIKPKKLKENHSVNDFNSIDDQILVMMKDTNIYPFQGWWPKICFIVTQVKEDPNVEIDQDALIITSKRTKKSRFNDDMSLVDLRPTVPSKWDSDYDDSPVADKVIEVTEIPQNIGININNDSIVVREEDNPSDITHQEEVMDTTSDIGKDEPKIEVNVNQGIPILSHESQVVSKLNTEYVEFLKIVSAENVDENIKNDTSNINVTTTAVEMENDINLSIKSDSLKCESVQDDSEEDTSNKSSNETVSLHNVTQRPIDISFVDNSSSIDKKIKKKKKSLHKKSKKNKKKGNKKRRHSKSSSSESSQDSESESDSSSEDSESDTSNSSTTVEKKKKKSKDKKKRKDKINYKKKHKSYKHKIKKFENENDSNSSILNLLEKAFNVEIKKRPLSESEGLRQKKKKRKDNKREDKSNENNEDKLEIVKECLKETFTKLVKTDKDNKIQLCDESTVNEVLKYLKIDKEKEKEKKKKKSKKSSKRKCDLDISEHDRTPKKSKLDNSSNFENSEKKKRSSKKKKISEKKSLGNNSVSKKNLKLTIDTSETEDGEESKHEKTQDEEMENFFGQRPNEWNMNKSSMRGVVYHSDIKTNDKPSKKGSNEIEGNAKINFEPPYVIDENACSLECYKRKTDETFKKSKNSLSLDIIEEVNKQENNTEIVSNIFDNSNIDNNVLKNNTVCEIKKVNLDNTELDNKADILNTENDKISTFIFDQSDKDMVKLKDDVSQTILSTECSNEEKDRNEDPDNITKLTLSKPLDQNDKRPITVKKLLNSTGESMSYRDKVKRNLKKLSTCQYIPFVFGFSSSLNLIKSNQLELEQIKKSFKAIKEEIKPKVDNLKLLKDVDKPKGVLFQQTESKKSKIDTEANNKPINQNSNWVDHDESNSNQSSLTSANIEHLCNEGKCELIKSSLLEHDLSNTNDEYLQYKNNMLSNDCKIKELEHTSDTIESNSSSDKENKEEFFSEHENITGEEISTSSHLSDTSGSEQNDEESLDSMKFHMSNEMSNTDNESVKKALFPELSYPDCMQNLEYSQIDNELITEWMSDWRKLVEAAADSNNSNNYNSDTPIIELQKKKKSRWDEPPNYEQKEYNEAMNNSFKNKDLSSNDDYFLEGQSLANKTPLINCVSDIPVYDHSETWSNEYADHSQSYYEYSDLPQYSEMTIVDNDGLSSVDYSMYEMYDPSYDFHDENDKMWKSVDIAVQPTIDEIPVIKQVENVLEVSSTNISNDETVHSKDEDELNKNIATIIPIKNELAEDENSEKSCRDTQFFKLFQQHFDHYNQNPIKYSLNDPVLSHLGEINASVLEKSPTQENSDFNNKEDNNHIPIPERVRAYSCLIKDHNTNVYLTSDNYVAYCAIEDKCMVHIAVNSSNLDGINDEVRHCFNINLNGGTIEYWLHANLIPFSISSDAESGVFSDDEEAATTASDSCQHDNADNDNESNDDIIEGEWEMVESSDDDCWPNNSHIRNKYGYTNSVEQTVTEIIPEAIVSSTSEQDSYESDFSDSYVETCSIENQNIAASTILESLIAKGNQNMSHSIAVDLKTEYKQTQNVATCSVVSTTEYDENRTPTGQLTLNIENQNNTNEITKEEDLVSEIKSETNENISIELKKKEDNGCVLDIPSNKEIAITDLSRMNTIINQQILIQRLKMRSKEKIQEKIPDTELVHYSDNMEIVKYPFLGLFQPPTFSILSKERNDNKMDVSKLSKRVTFADGIRPGDNEAVSPTHNEFGRPMSPLPLKTLMRETLKLKRNMYPYKRSKMRIKLKMLKKKVAKVIPSIKDPTSSSVVEYYISRRRLGDLQIVETANNAVEHDNSLSSDNNHDRSRTHDRSILRLQRTTRELTPVPSDNEGWSDNVI